MKPKFKNFTYRIWGIVTRITYNRAEFRLVHRYLNPSFQQNWRIKQGVSNATY